MTTFWLSVGAGCVASAAFGFSFVRYAVPALPTFQGDGEPTPAWRVIHESAPAPLPARVAATVLRERPPPAEPAPPAPRLRPAPAASPARRRAAPRMPAPTAPRPEAAKLALWTRQIKAGERKMSIATDGCRVTWDRTCKHGHPTWLVRLGYLQRSRPPLKRHRPR